MDSCLTEISSVQVAGMTNSLKNEISQSPKMAHFEMTKTSNKLNTKRTPRVLANYVDDFTRNNNYFFRSSTF